MKAKLTADDVKQAARECGVTASAIRWRIRQGWAPVEVMHQRKSTLRQEMQLAAAKHGLTIRAIEQRFYEYRWPLEKALNEPRRNPWGR